MKASVRAYDSLRRDIVELRLPPGSLLGEVEQATRLGLSRTPIREALTKLVTDGLAVQLRGRGVVVSDISVADVRTLFELRVALEVQAARLAARRGDRVVFVDLAERFTELAARPVGTLSPETHYALSAELDDALDAATDNPYLVQSLINLRTHLTRLRRLAKDHPVRLTASANEHGAIAEAVAAGDPELAAAAVLLHLHHAQDHITRATGIERTP